MINVTHGLQLLETVLKNQPLHLQVFWNHRGDHHQAAVTIYFQPIPSDYFMHFILPELSNLPVLEV